MPGRFVQSSSRIHRCRFYLWYLSSFWVSTIDDEVNSSRVKAWRTIDHDWLPSCAGKDARVVAEPCSRRSGCVQSWDWTGRLFVRSCETDRNQWADGELLHAIWKEVAGAPNPRRPQRWVWFETDSSLIRNWIWISWIPSWSFVSTNLLDRTKWLRPAVWSIFRLRLTGKRECSGHSFKLLRFLLLTFSWAST